jgi:hypothetical protein
MTETSDRTLAARQKSVDAQKNLQASLHCDRVSFRWDIVAIGVSLLVPFLSVMIPQPSTVRVALQYFLSALVAFLLWRRSGWKERGRKLRNEFEYFTYGISKPYRHNLKPEDIDRWQRFYKNRPTNKDTETWFRASPGGDSFEQQIKNAQLESIVFGSTTRILWSGIVFSISAVVLAAYFYVEREDAFASTGMTLSTVAVIAATTQIGKIAYTSFKYGRKRSRLAHEIRPFAPTGDDVIKSLAIFQERINSARADRVIVPRFVYLTVSFFTDLRQAIKAKQEAGS